MLLLHIFINSTSLSFLLLFSRRSPDPYANEIAFQSTFSRAFKRISPACEKITNQPAAQTSTFAVNSSRELNVYFPSLCSSAFPFPFPIPFPNSHSPPIICSDPFFNLPQKMKWEFYFWRQEPTKVFHAKNIKREKEMKCGIPTMFLRRERRREWGKTWTTI